VSEDPKILSNRKCIQCGNGFTPKPMGYRAEYCSPKCKHKKRYSVSDKERARAYRNRSYERYTPEQMAEHRRYGRESLSKVRAWLSAYKVERGCVDCGFNKHPAALQLDHEGVKTNHISSIRTSRRRLLEEIERGKCVVRCANCHAIKTVERRAARVLQKT
jgi:LSD1 subclass zinc finger protein